MSPSVRIGSRSAPGTSGQPFGGAFACALGCASATARAEERKSPAFRSGALARLVRASGPTPARSFQGHRPWRSLDSDVV